MLMQKMSSSKSNVTADGRLVSSEEHQAATTEKYGFEKVHTETMPIIAYIETEPTW